MIAELIKIESKGGKDTVNARDLHAFLEVGKDFSTWIKDRVEKYGFNEGLDFIKIDSPILGNQTGRGGDRRSIDYFLSLDMAKELSMVENNDRGRQARLYFIEVEKRARSLINPPTGAQLIALAVIEAQKVLEAQAHQIEEMTPKARYFDAVAGSKDAVHMSEVAKVLDVPGMGRNNLFQFLRDHKVLMQDNQPYQRHIDEGHFRLVQSQFSNSKTGGVEIAYTTLVYQKGIKFILGLLAREGFFPRKVSEALK